MELGTKHNLNKRLKSESAKLASVLIKSGHEAKDIGLLSGLSGEALFLFYYSKLSGVRQCQQRGFSFLQQAFNKIGAERTLDTHCSGLAGLGWTVMHLHETNLLPSDADTLLKDIDAYLEKSIIGEIQTQNFDFLHGATGMILYLLKRVHYNGKLLQTIRLFVGELTNTAINDKDSIKWPDLFSKQRNIVFNISLSHGMSAMVVLLSKLIEAGIETKSAARMLKGVVSYILRQQLPKGEHQSCFPSFSLESADNIISSRLAWCYGDLGIASSLWLAGKVLRNITWKEKAAEVFLHAAKRTDKQEAEVKDTGFCHGTAGIAHIFNRAYHNTGMEKLAEARDFWLNQSMQMACFSDGLAGYKAWSTMRNEYVNQTNLLEGISGIGLTFLSVVYPQYMGWDEGLLLS